VYVNGGGTCRNGFFVLSQGRKARSPIRMQYGVKLPSRRGIAFHLETLFVQSRRSFERSLAKMSVGLVFQLDGSLQKGNFGVGAVFSPSSHCQ
jgi:hypothetical protein